MACTHKYKHKHTKLNWCHASIGTRTGSFKIVTVFLILYGIVSPHVMNSGIRQIFAFGIRNPLKFFPRNRNLGFGIPLKMGIRNPSSTDIDLESLPGIRKESLAWNPESKTVLGSLTWDDWSFHTWPVRCKHLSLSPSNKTAVRLPSSCHCLNFVLTSLRTASVLCFVGVQTFLYLCCWTRGTRIAIKDHVLVGNKQWPALRSPCNVFIQTTHKWYRQYKEKESIRWHRRLNRSR